MRKRELYHFVLTHFQTTMPEVQSELNFDSTFQLLVAVVLSAQCTDKRVNQVTPALFTDYPTAEAMAMASPEVIYEYIKSISYPNSKAKHLSDMAKILWKSYGGEVPQTADALKSLPGVGQKTANVILSVAFGKAAMAVDTHIFRVSHRLGLVNANCSTPLSVEKELIKYIPKELIPKAHHWLLLHGRYVCTAHKPKCHECALKQACAFYKKNASVL